MPHSNAYFHRLNKILLFCYRQSLTVDGEHHPIILNTHFSQKVLGATNQENRVDGSKVLCLKEKTKPYPLIRCFGKKDEAFKTSQASDFNTQVCDLSSSLTSVNLFTKVYWHLYWINYILLYAFGGLPWNNLLQMIHSWCKRSPRWETPGLLVLNVTLLSLLFFLLMDLKSMWHCGLW